MLFFLLEVILVFQYIQCNLLRTTDFKIPIIPEGIIFYQIGNGSYHRSAWIFNKPAVYVPYSFPHPRRVHTHHHQQALFIENNDTIVVQSLRSIHFSPVILKLIFSLRMPYLPTEGQIQISLEQSLVMIIKFERTVQNLMLEKISFVSMDRAPQELIIKGGNFETNFANRNGFQLFEVAVKNSDEIEMKKYENLESNSRKRKSEERDLKFSPPAKLSKLWY